jgi:hypothetical protein
MSKLEDITSELKKINELTLKDKVEALQEAMEDKVKEDKLSEQLSQVIDWLCKLTHAHKVKWSSLGDGAANYHEVDNFTGFKITLSKTWGSYYSSELFDMKNKVCVGTSGSWLRAGEFDTPPVGKPVLYLTVKNRSTGTIVFDNVKHEDLNKLQAEIYWHLGSNGLTDVEDFYKSIKRAFEYYDKRPEAAAWE